MHSWLDMFLLVLYIYIFDNDSVTFDLVCPFTKYSLDLLFLIFYAYYITIIFSNLICRYRHRLEYIIALMASVCVLDGEDEDEY